MYELSLSETRKKLRQWGLWYNSILAMGLGFSNKSILGQLIDAKGELIKSSQEQLVPANETAEKIDALVNQLAGHEFEKARILCIHYTVIGSKELKIQKANVSRATYFRYLAAAECWISEQI